MKILLDKNRSVNRSNQLDLFNPIEQPEAPKLSIEPVPRELAIAPNRFYLEVRHYERCWYYPIQFSEVEAHWIYPKVKDLDWSLGDKGFPVESALIYQTVELLIDGGVGA
jgi:hypothetical protein